ncbi:MAG TPA: amidohydrolase [Anaerolineales bacterium]|nr:amidohydrolase [Anaerolineales bacterium]
MTEKSDLIIKNAVILTMDANLTIHSPGALAIKGDSILAAGPQEEILAAYPGSELMDAGGKILLPGLINAHTHVPMTLLRGLADDLRLDVWLMGYIMPVEREYVSPEFVRLGTSIACAELIRSGVTCFADMYYFEEHVAQATAAAGMRAVCSQTTLKFPAPDALSFEDSLAAARSFIQAWKDHPLIVPSVAPHSPYTCTPEILKATASLAAEFDVPLHTHLAETGIEVENMRRDNNMPVIPYVKKQGLFEAKVLAAHCVHVDQGEINTLFNHGAGVAHNPSSNLKLASGFAPVKQMLESGLNVGIGTDGPASNNDLDMFEEIRLASFIAKGISGDPTMLPAHQALSMATRIGAQALHIGHLTGSLEPGKRADLILLDPIPIHNSPKFERDESNLYARIVYSSKSTDVTDVMVNGRWLMRGRELLTLKEEELLEHASDYARRIDSFLVQREKSVLSKLIAIGGAEEGESFEVQSKVRINDPSRVLEAIQGPGLEILYHRHYHQYDTYFLFDDPEQGSVRYREDEFIDPDGKVTTARYRLTLIGPVREAQFPSDVLLSRSRFIAPAIHSLRFYREYFKPTSELFIEKDRLRWRVLFQGTEFYINIDRVDQPALGTYLEVKSRTWSQRDADAKAHSSRMLIDFLGVSQEATVSQDYLEIAREGV